MEGRIQRAVIDLCLNLSPFPPEQYAQLTAACLCIMQRSDPELTSTCTESLSGDMCSQFLCVLLENPGAHLPPHIPFIL